MRWRRWGLTFLVLFLLLVIRFYLFSQTRPDYKAGQEIKLVTTLLSEPQATGKIQKFYANDVLIIVPRFPEYHYGDSLTITGSLEKRVLDSKKQVLTIYFPKIKKHPPPSGLALVSSIRQRVMTVFNSSLPQTESGLLLGITLGIKENLPRELLDSLKISGTLHVVAASGMNVTMVGAFLSSVFGLLLRRQIALVLSIFGIFFYAVLAGLEPSIVRASIMGAISYSALILGRQNLAVLTLFLTGYLMLLVSPGTLFDVGFQLSFMATLGLVTIKPALDRQVIIGKFTKYQVGNDLTTTVSAQLATLPILLSNFGSYSLLSIFANSLVLWTIAPLMVLGAIASIFSLFLAPLSGVLLIFTLPLLLYFEKTVSFFASLGGFTVENFPLLVSLGYYLLLISIILLLKKNE